MCSARRSGTATGSTVAHRRRCRGCTGSRRTWRDATAAPRRRHRAHARLSGADDIDAPPDAETRADAQAASPSIARALARLRSRDRDTLLLFAWGQLSYEEIASALDVPVGTVRSRLHRARQQMRRALGDAAPAETVIGSPGEEPT